MKNNIYILSLFIVSIFFVGCDENEIAAIIDESAKPIVTYTISSTNAPEIDTPEIIISISMDRPVKTTTTFTAAQVGGNAVLHEDYEVSGGVIPAYQTEGEIVISINSDLDVEGNETIDFQVGAAGIPDVYEVLGTTELTVTIEDYEFCLWNLVGNDAYGDGWQGGHVLVEFDGNAVQYAPHDDSDTFDIPITKGSAYTISYVSGTPGSGAGAPGYEEENTYTLTAPDGTTYSDGPIPAEGEIASGTCN